MSRFAFFGPVVIQSSRGDYEIVTREFRNALLYCLQNHPRTSLREHVQWMLRRCHTPMNLQRVLTALGHSSHQFDITLILDVQIVWPKHKLIRRDYDSMWELLVNYCLSTVEFDRPTVPEVLRAFAVNNVVPKKQAKSVPLMRMERMKPDKYDEVDDDSDGAIAFDLARQIIGQQHREATRFDGDFEPYRLH